MSAFAGADGDRRRAAAAARLYGSMVEQHSVVVRKLGVDRGGELSLHRVLSSARMTPEATVACLARPTAAAVRGRRIVAVQDTTEVNFAGRQSRGLGRAGRQGRTPGFFIHATVAVDAETDAVLGLVDAAIWTRDGAAATGRRQRVLAGKESQRWLAAAETAASRLHAAAALIVVGDRESDIYALFSRRPATTELLVRAAQNRRLADGTQLFAAAATWPVLGEQRVKLAPSRPGARGREAVVGLRAGTVLLRRPRHARREGDPDCLPVSLPVSLVEAIETAPPETGAPLHYSRIGSA